ncbi:LacI family DNA-binding transcriptional regulator [Brachybacterium hainanense]|uniref:LacI family DNA-binding transcriptional regulator n=1 Tax=Brachybacterium hainanense TaxID=1541174 RepID=A0ABV6RCM9_9MICO
MKARLIDIAREADVSEATVSRVLNDRPGVNEETRQLVLQAARRLGRQIMPVPEELPRMIGLLVPDLENQIFAAWVERLEAELFERGVSSLVGVRARTVEREREHLQRFLRAGASGIIVVSGFHAQQSSPLDHYREVTDAGVPLVMVNGERHDLDAAFISSDDVHAIELSLAHLEELGHRRIGLAVGDEHTWPVRTKVQAFEAARRAAGEPGAPIAYTDFSYAGGYEAARDLAGRGVTAIVCGSDVMASGALEGLRSIGLSTPEDVSVLGYDDVSWAGLTTPPLTTIRQSVSLMARSAVRTVLAGGQGSRRPTRTELAIRPQLIVRGSTGAAPGRSR